MTEAMEHFSQQGLSMDALCVKAFPFVDDVQTFIDNHQYIFVIEQNRDAQMRTLLTTELGIEQKKLIPILHYMGDHASSING